MSQTVFLALLLIFSVTNEVYSHNCEVQQDCPRSSVDQDETTIIFLPIPSDCAKFIQCDRGYPYIVNCPSGLHFNRILNVCDWPASAKCEPCDNTVQNVEHRELSFKNNAEVSSSVCDNADAHNYLFPFPSDCAKFISCSSGIPYEMLCPIGLHFNNQLKICDFPTFAKCNIKTTAIIRTTSSTTTILGDESSTSADFCAQATAHKYLFPFPTDCTKFISCSNGVPYTMHCPAGLHFNSRMNACDYVSSARCTILTTSTIITTTEAPIFTTEVVTSTSEIETIATDTGTTLEFVEDTTTPEETDVMNTPVLGEPTPPCPLDSFSHNVLLPVTNDCDKFISCANGVPLVINCPKGLHFSVEISLCDWPHLANCTVGTVAPTTTIYDTKTFELTSTTTGGGIEDSTSSDTPTTAQPTTALEKTTIDIETKPEIITSITSATTNMTTVDGSTTDELTTTLAESLVDQTTMVIASIIDDDTEVSTTTSNASAIPELIKTEETTTEDVSQAQPDTTNQITVTLINDTITFDDRIIDDVTDVPTTSDISITSELSTTPDEPANNSSTQTIISISATETDTTSIADTNFTTTSDPEISKYICPVESFSHHVLLPVAGDCGKFILCENGAPYLIDCPIGLHFNIEISLCDWPHLANCSLVTNTATPVTTIDNTTWEELTTITLEPNTTFEAQTESVITSTTTNDIAAVELTSTTIRTTDNEIEDNSTFVDSSIDDVAQVANTMTFDTPTEPQTTTADEETTVEEITINDESHPKTTAQITDSSTNITTASHPEVSKSICPVESFSHHVLLPVASDCGKFILCENGTPYLMDCPTGLHFNIEINLCDWPHLANCSLANTTRDLPTTKDATTYPVLEELEFSCPVASFAHFVLLPVANDCGKFISCQNGIAHKMSCPKGLHFNVEANYCDWPYLANCTVYENIIKVVTDITTIHAPEELESPCPVDSFSQFGLLPVPGDCGKFISCENGVPHEMNCPSGLHFNVEYKLCDWPHLANCTTVATTVAAPSTSTDATTVEDTTTEAVPASEFITITLENVTEASSTTSEGTSTTSDAETEPVTTPNEEITIINEELATAAAIVTTTVEVSTTTKQVAFDSSTTPSDPKLTTVEDTTTKLINDEAATTTDELSTTTTVTETTIITTALPASALVITNSSTATSDSKPTSVEDTTTEIVKVTSTTSTYGSDKLTTTITFAAATTQKVQNTTTMQSNVSPWRTTTITDTSSTTSEPEGMMTTSETVTEHAIKTNEERIISSEEVSTTAAAVTASVEVPPTTTQAAIDSSTSTSEPESTTTEATTTEIVYETSTTTTEGLTELTTTDVSIDETTTFPSTRLGEVSTTTSTTEEIMEMSSTTSEATTNTSKDATTPTEERITTEQYSTTTAVETISVELLTATTQDVIDSSTSTEPEPTRLEDTVTDSDELTTTTEDNSTATTVTVTTTKQIGESSWKTTTMSPVISTSEVTTNPAIVKATTIREEITTMVPNDSRKSIMNQLKLNRNLPQ